MNLNTLPDGPPRAEQRTELHRFWFHADYALVRDIHNHGNGRADVGDYRRPVDLSSEWFVRPDMSFVLQLTYYKNDTPTDDNIVSLRYRFTL